MRADLWTILNFLGWLRTNEQSIAIWLEGIALVAIFILELVEYKRQGRERIEQHKESGPPRPPDYRDPNQESGDDVVFECSIQIENHGRTIAHIETVQIGADCINGPFPEEPLNFHTRNLHSILGSGQKETVGEFTAHSFLEWREILDGTKRGFLQIKVKYRDAVGTSTRHETSVVYIFQGSVEDEPQKVSTLSVYT
jgi:hypothetical protein